MSQSLHLQRIYHALLKEHFFSSNKVISVESSGILPLFLVHISLFILHINRRLFYVCPSVDLVQFPTDSEDVENQDDQTCHSQNFTKAERNRWYIYNQKSFKYFSLILSFCSSSWKTNKNTAYGTHWISRLMQIVASIP